ncbi:MAG: PKD domain-containing protein, partial [Bacteroidota bacterium]
MNRVAVCLALLCSQVCGVCLFGQLNADFQHDKAQKSNCSPVTIQFTNTSTGSPDRYEWTINGREFSILEHPIRTFVDTGRFEICLEVEDANAQIDKTCQFLSFFGSPQLQLSTADSILCQPGEVSFQLSSNVSLDRISWDFGDGQVEEEALNGRQNIDKRHLYNAPGAYSVVVSVVDENGCEKTVLKKSLVNFPPLIAPDFSFTSLSGCPHSKQLIFQAASFYAHCLYDWSFGDGKTARGQSVIHNYARFGQYDVRLRLTDTLTNCTYEVVKNNPLEYEDIKFDLQITESADCQERNIQFQPPDGLSYVRFEWNFDDGHTTATDTFPTHVYAQNGCFLPSFTFIASDGCITTVHAERCIQINGTHAIDIQQDGHWEGCAEDPGLQIDLVASSDLAGMAWEWQMAGFDTLKRADPSFRINEFGTYPLSLLATYLNGCTRLLPIDTAKLLPVELSFSADVLQGCVPLEVALELEVTSLDSILSYDWQIGSINLSGATPAITIPDTGTFDVQVTVQTLTGCTAQATRPNYISVGQPPTLDFWAVPLISCAEDSTKFFCTSDVPLDRWHWLFGDGLSASGPDPWHHYVDTGLFNVVLTAWHKGCSSTLTKDNYVTIYPPVAKAAYEVDCNNPLSVQFIDNSIGAQRWEWDFGDGHKSSLQHPQHRYRESGHYEVILTVWNDDHGCRDAVETAIVVTDEKAVFDLSRTQLCQGDTLHIINHSIYGESFQFRIPQGVEIIQNGLSDPRPVLRFVEPGLFRGFDLRQVDANGCISNFRLNKEVDVEGVRVDFSADPTGGCPGLEVHFRNESSATTGSPLDYTWTFGFRGHTSKKEHPSHIFNGEDSYNISLKAISDRGCKEEEVKEDMVNVNAPKAGFGSTLIDCEMNIVQFRSQSSGGAGLSYHWSFGDGRFSESSVPLHIFESEGKYEVCLTVTNPFNCADQFCDSIDVVNVQADFTADKTYKSCPNPPLVTRFEDLSYNGVAWEWDFGDQTAKSYLQNPSHTYSEVGIYTVCLTSWDKDGCSHTFCRDDYIQVDGPTGSFEVSQQEGCAPLDVSFVGQVSQVASLYWDFGDGAGIRNAGIINQDSVQYTYANPGFYIPVLVLEDTSGCRISRIGEMIEVRSLDFDFAASINSQCEGALSPIDFFVQMDTSGADYDFEWQFAGGTPASSTEANPQQISYSSPGIYDVILQVTENGECLTSLHK